MSCRQRSFLARQARSTVAPITMLLFFLTSNYRFTLNLSPFLFITTLETELFIVVRHGNTTSVRDVVLMRNFCTVRNPLRSCPHDIIWACRAQSFRLHLRQFHLHCVATSLTRRSGPLYLQYSFGIVSEFFTIRIIIPNEVNAKLFSRSVPFRSSSINLSVALRCAPCDISDHHYGKNVSSSCCDDLVFRQSALNPHKTLLAGLC